jgi:hypothetical protein
VDTRNHEVDTSRWDGITDYGITATLSVTP